MEASCTIEKGLMINHTGTPTGGSLGLRAVVFDFGMVLSGPPNPEPYADMLRITGLPPEKFEHYYWADRLAYDRGDMTGPVFWQKLVRDAALDLSPEQIDELHRLDVMHWTTQNPAMLTWQKQLQEHGLITGILSNMGDSVLASLEQNFNWLPRFDVLVWSFQLRLVKPDPAIYHYLLEKLGTMPEETLFIDDRRINVEAALALGMRAIEFSTIEKLRQDLVAATLAGELPLPQG
jgi:putative hydrolase of the HAD superfamily